MLHHRSPHGTFSIRCVPMGHVVTYSWCLQFIIKVSARFFLNATCTYGTLLHPTCIYGACSYSSVKLAIRHKSPLGPFSIRRVPAGSFNIQPVGPDGLCVTCTWDRSPSPFDLWDPMAHLHLTCGTRRLACHLTLAIRHKNLCSVLLHQTCGTR
jgi:hypothetical protein